MDLSALIAFNIALLAAMAAPGPALMLAIRQSVAGGFATGFATGVGLALAACLWTAAALLGLHAVFAVVPWAYLALKTAGALYLLWLAYGLWRDAGAPVGDAPAARGRAVATGVLVNLANPKSVLFAASVLIVVFPRDMALWEKAAVVGNHFVVECVVYGLVAACLSSPPAQAAYLRLKSMFDRVAAVVLGGLGLRLLLDR